MWTEGDLVDPPRFDDAAGFAKPVEQMLVEAAVEELLADADIEHVAAAAPSTEEPVLATGSYVGNSPVYRYVAPDHAETVNKNRIPQLQARPSESLCEAVTLSGQASVLANYQESNRDRKFGYLMRNPTSPPRLATRIRKQ
jgi:hypothetical protein